MFHETLNLTRTELHDLRRAFTQARELGHERFLFKGTEFRAAHAHNTLSNAQTTRNDCVTVDLQDAPCRLDSEDLTIPVLTGRLST